MNWDQKPLCIAHRGASADRPENTLAAFRRALEVGADAVEFDVRLTDDGQPVVVHDALVNRTTDGKGAVAELTLAQIQRMDAGSWFAPQYADERVPTLGEAIGAIGGRAGLVIELKQRYLEQQVLTALQAASLGGQALIVSFVEQALAECHRLAPEVETGWLIARWREGRSPSPQELVAQAQQIGAGVLGPPFDQFTAEVVEAAHAAGMRVLTWTLDHPDEIRHAAELGADAIATNRPALMLEALRRKG